MSAFSEVVRPCLSTWLQRAAGEQQNQAGLGKQQQLRTSNLLRQSTIGVRQAYVEMVAASRFGGPIQSRPQSHSDASGKLLVGPSIPLLGKRYRLQDSVGEGTFSQIFKAVDLNGAKAVAIKVMTVGFHLLGAREDAFLRFLAGRTLRGCQHFARVVESFRFEQHFCLVMDLYDCTLMQLLAMPKNGSEGLSGGAKPLLAPQPGLHQPRVVRHTPQATSLEGQNYSPPPDLMRIRKIAVSLVSALCIMKNEGAIHTDLKPENCFLRWSPSALHKIEESTSSSSSSSSNNGGGGGGPFIPQQPQLHLNELPDDFQVHLGDFGNSIHISEVAKEYQSFDIQSLPYRAPEVLLGIPFDFQIDVWSLGIILVELCIGQPLFLVRSREELLAAMLTKLSPLPLARFSGGKYQELFQKQKHAFPSASSSRVVDYTAHLVGIKKLLGRSSPLDASSDLVHFIAGLLHPDPDLRLTAHDALRHPFLAHCLSVPQCLLAGADVGAGATRASILQLRARAEGKNEVKVVSPRSLGAPAPTGASRGSKDPLHFAAAPFSPSSASSSSSVFHSLPFPAKEKDKVVHRHHHQSQSPGTDSLLALSSSGSKSSNSAGATARAGPPLAPQAKLGRGAQQGGGSLLSIGIDLGSSNNSSSGGKRPRSEVNYSDAI